MHMSVCLRVSDGTLNSRVQQMQPLTCETQQQEVHVRQGEGGSEGVQK
jgi:hypothetical protein